MTQDPPTVTLPKKPQFDVARRGYECSQVDQHIAKLHREMAQLTANLRQEREFARTGSVQLIAERDNALQQLQSARDELASLRGTVDETTVELRPRDEISLFGGRLQTILLTAEQEASAAKAEAREAAERIRAEAAERADALLSGARQEADAVLAAATRDAEELRARAKQETDELRANAKQETDELRTRTEQETDELRANTEQETAELRARIEQETGELRTRTEQETAELRARTEQEAQTLLAEARAQAAELTERANADAERVTTAAERNAAATLEAARRDESQVRASLAELVQRREQVRRELTGIGSAIESLLGEAVPDADVTEAPDESPAVDTAAGAGEDTAGDPELAAAAAGKRR